MDERSLAEIRSFAPPLRAQDRGGGRGYRGYQSSLPASFARALFFKSLLSLSLLLPLLLRPENPLSLFEIISFLSLSLAVYETLFILRARAINLSSDALYTLDNI